MSVTYYRPHTSGLTFTRPAKRLPPKGAPPKGGKVFSKKQQRWAFANRMPWAHAAAKSGVAYKKLPVRKRSA